MRNDPFAIVESLATQARREPLPRVDVANRVIPRLRRPPAAPVSWMAAIASGAVLAAVATTVAVLPVIDFFTNPLNAYLLSAVGWLR